MSNSNYQSAKYSQIAQDIKRLAVEMGFHEARIADPKLLHEESHFLDWLNQGYAGEMDYLQRNIELRLQPSNLFPNTQSVICVCARYPKVQEQNYPLAAFAQIEDYHRIVKKLLKTFCRKLGLEKRSRIFCGSAPVLEKALAARAGIGWIGKNSLVVNKLGGSYLFLGEIFTDVVLPYDQPVANLCGNCTRCIANCPTGALVAAHLLDARKCIAYLTIEYQGSIPLELREKIGQRIFGCDACQQACPWNMALNERNQGFLEHWLQPSPAGATITSSLADLMLWDENEFRAKTAKTPIKRISFVCWLRNLAIALGNSAPSTENIAALKQRKNFADELVQEHCQWALNKLGVTI